MRGAERGRIAPVLIAVLSVAAVAIAALGLMPAFEWTTEQAGALLVTFILVAGWISLLVGWQSAKKRA